MKENRFDGFKKERLAQLARCIKAVSDNALAGSGKSESKKKSLNKKSCIALANLMADCYEDGICDALLSVSYSFSSVVNERSRK